jgi:AcrR family transcriptional regulator
MARALSNEKRQVIIETAKRLFAEGGFMATSVADIARAAEIPVGSIYTYFDSKEKLIRSIVDEGWEDLKNRLVGALAAAETPEQRFKLLVDTFLPELLGDLDFITILLTEGIGYTRIEEKTQELTSILSTVLGPVSRDAPGLSKLSETDVEVALLVYFLGVLGAVRITKAADLSVTSSDVLQFLRTTIQNGLGVSF